MVSCQRGKGKECNNHTPNTVAERTRCAAPLSPQCSSETFRRFWLRSVRRSCVLALDSRSRTRGRVLGSLPPKRLLPSCPLSLLQTGEPRSPDAPLCTASLTSLWRRSGRWPLRQDAVRFLSQPNDAAAGRVASESAVMWCKSLELLAVGWGCPVVLLGSFFSVVLFESVAPAALSAAETHGT